MGNGVLVGVLILTGREVGVLVGRFNVTSDNVGIGVLVDNGKEVRVAVDLGFGMGVLVFVGNIATAGIDVIRGEGGNAVPLSAAPVKRILKATVTTTTAASNNGQGGLGILNPPTLLCGV